MENLDKKKGEPYTFKYFPSEQFMIVSDSAVQLHGLKKHYTNMPESFIKEISEDFRDDAARIFQKIDTVLYAEPAVIKIKESNILYKITFIVSEVENEKPKTVIGFMEDITERVKSEENAKKVARDGNFDDLLENLKNSTFLNGLGEIYFVTYMFDFRKHSYMCLSSKKGLHLDLVNAPDLDSLCDNFIENIVADEDKEKMREFCDTTTLQERIGITNSLEQEYMSRFKGPCRATFIVSEVDSNGTPVKALFLCKDIAKEKMLSEAQQTLIRALGTAYQNIYSVNFVTGDVKIYRQTDYISKKYDPQSHYEVKYDEYVQLYVANEVHKDDQSYFTSIKTLSDVRSIFETKQHYSFSYRVVRSGKTEYFRCQLVRASADSPDFVIAFKNIDDELDLELQRQRQFNEQIAIIRALSEEYKSVYCLDTHTGLVSPYRLNYQYREDFQHLLESDIQWNTILKIYAEKFVEEPYKQELFERFCTENITKFLSGKQYLSYEFKNRKDGISRFYKVKATKLSDIPNETKIVIGFSDINEQHEQQLKIQTALKEAFHSADAANRAKSDFLANMSHDIRTPMNAIVGMTAIAQAHIDEKERVLDCLDKIKIASNHLLSLINEVLDLSKIESGKMDLINEEFSLSDLTENLLTLVRPQIREHSHNLVVEIHNLRHETVIGDSLRMKQIFLNILSNAIKYTPDGGEIKLYFTEKPTPQKNIKCFEFSCTDNGFGISPEAQKELFQPFMRSSSEQTAHIQGTGLGLTISRNIARLMGGDITVKSELGKGSVFTTTVFLKTKETEEDYSRFRGKKVLTLSSEPVRMESVCSTLESISLNRICAKNEADAISNVAKGDIRAVFIDFDMKGIDPFAITQKIRETGGSELPIVAITAFDWTDIEQKAKNAGVSEFLSRPLFKSRLVKMLDMIFRLDNSAQNSATLEPFSELEFSNLRALLVEDNDLNAEIATEILKMTGINVCRVSDGTEAVQQMLEKSEGYFDIVFMDIQMPKLNGYDATRAIRKLPGEYCKKIPIIAMTANAFADDVQAALNSGMNAHISKPLDLTALADTLEKWLKHKKS